MIQAVVDVNVLISALVGPLGFSRRLLTAWEQGQFGLITAEGIITELDEKLRLPRIAKWLPDPEASRQWIIHLLQSQSKVLFVSPHERQEVTGDPEDDLVLAAVRLGRADYFVTGDRELLDLQEYAGARMVSPRDFVAILEAQPP
ncbi:MAG TPA: putative toxin-antitoxin system toxin component, PIN family [Chloroflexota bacterium]|nr:putative toxin-antitoxin system toxin component, PIN family [Chloroflexota bacterium]